HFERSREAGGFEIETKDNSFHCEKLLIATGSSVKFWNHLKQIGHSIIEPVPSLFTFNIKDARITDIPGVVAPDVEVKVLDTDLYSSGPLLITHWGMSAPAILKLSAFGALELAKKEYKFQIEINFIKRSFEACLEELKDTKVTLAKKTVFKSACFNLPKRLWQQLVVAAEISNEMRWEIGRAHV